MNIVAREVVRALRAAADNIEAGNSNLEEEQALDILSVVCHNILSKDRACSFINVSRSRFDELVRQGKLPKGRKRRGFKELVWYEDELRQCLKQLTD